MILRLFPARYFPIPRRRECRRGAERARSLWPRPSGFRSGSSRRWCRRLQRSDRRCPAEERLGRVSSLPCRPILGERLLLRRHLADRSDHRPDHRGQLDQPQPQYFPVGQPRPVYRLSPRRRHAGGSGRRGGGGRLSDRCPVSAGARPPPISFSMRWPRPSCCGCARAACSRAESQLNVSVAKLRAGSATRSDSLRSLVTLGNGSARPDRDPGSARPGGGKPGPAHRPARTGSGRRRFGVLPGRPAGRYRRRSAPRPSRSLPE